MVLKPNEQRACKMLPCTVGHSIESTSSYVLESSQISSMLLQQMLQLCLQHRHQRYLWYRGLIALKSALLDGQLNT